MPFSDSQSLGLETVDRYLYALDTFTPAMYQTISDITPNTSSLTTFRSVPDLRQVIQFWNTSTSTSREVDVFQNCITWRRSGMDRNVVRDDVFGVISEIVWYIARANVSKALGSTCHSYYATCACLNGVAIACNLVYALTCTCVLYLGVDFTLTLEVITLYQPMMHICVMVSP